MPSRSRACEAAALTSVASSALVRRSVPTIKDRPGAVATPGVLSSICVQGSGTPASVTPIVSRMRLLACASACLVKFVLSKSTILPARRATIALLMTFLVLSIDSTHAIDLSPFRFLVRRCGIASGNPPEGRARHEARAGRIVVVEQAADHLAAAIQTLDRPPVGADHLRVFVNFEPAEGKGDAPGRAVGVVRRLVDAKCPVGFFQRQAGA